MGEVFFLNGKFLRKGPAEVSVLEPAYLYGQTVFETMRLCEGRIVYFKEHIERIRQSCRALDMKFPYSQAGIKKIILEAARISGFSDSCVRLTVGKSIQGQDVIVFAKRYSALTPEKYRLGFRAQISCLRQCESSALSGIKSGNRLIYELAYSRARKNNFDEAIILNTRGYLAEASRSNIFLVRHGMLHTPALACGCLEGITRKVVFGLAGKNNIRIREGNFTLLDLYRADGAFLTNSLMGIMPLRSVEKHVFKRGAGNNGPAQFFIKKYNLLLRNRI